LKKDSRPSILVLPVPRPQPQQIPRSDTCAPYKYTYLHTCIHNTTTTPCPKKTKQICFCQNFVKFSPISIIFGRKMGNDPYICEVHSFSTSPNLRHHLTLLNANVPNCYITPKLLVIDRSHW